MNKHFQRFIHLEFPN